MLDFMTKSQFLLAIKRIYSNSSKEMSASAKQKLMATFAH